MSEPVINDKNLVSGLRKGDHASWTIFYNAYKVILYDCTKKTVADPMDAKDIVADVFHNCWKLKMNMETIEDYKAYLFVSCRNRSIDYLRLENLKQKHASSISAEFYQRPDEKLMPAAHVEFVRSEVRMQLYNAVQEMPPQTSRVITMLFFEDKSVQEVAESLQISPQTVRNLKTKGLKGLRDKFSNQDIDLVLLLMLFDYYVFR